MAVEHRVFAAGGIAAAVRTPAEWSAHPQGKAVAEEPPAVPRRSTAELVHVEMALDKSDFGIAQLYASLVSDTGIRDRVFAKLEAEFQRTRRSILAITEQ